MAKAAKKAVGELLCPCCKAKGRVYKSARTDGKLYWLCNCGGHQPLLQAGQDYILEVATMYGPDGPPGDPAPAPAAEISLPPPAPARPPRKDFLEW